MEPGDIIKHLNEVTDISYNSQVFGTACYIWGYKNSDRPIYENHKEFETMENDIKYLFESHFPDRFTLGHEIYNFFFKGENKNDN